jgi:hypothetical protein
MTKAKVQKKWWERMSAFVRLWYRLRKVTAMCGIARSCSVLLAFSELSFVFAIGNKRVARFEVRKREHGDAR